MVAEAYHMYNLVFSKMPNTSCACNSSLILVSEKPDICNSQSDSTLLEGRDTCIQHV